MANPSTGFGGAGTEVLRRGYMDGLTNAEATLLTGVANHIYTVLSIVFCNLASSSDETIHMYIDGDLIGADIYLLNTQPLNAASTFIFSDRFVLTETDKLHASTSNSADVDVWVSYIDQQLA
jgi:hypothetical protein